MTFGKTFAALLLGATSAAALASASHAADAQAEQAPAGFNWSGVYVGFGGGVGAVERGTEMASGGVSVGVMDLGGQGVFAEVTAGYDYLVSERVLLGGFIDAHAGNIAFAVENAFGPGELSLKNKYGFDVAARAGYLLTPSTLGYVLGGYSWQHIALEVPVPVPFDTEKDRSGYVLGVGMETAVSSNWTVKSEYRYANYGNNVAIEDVGVGALMFEPTTHTFHVGANYRFGAQNGGGASFAAPAYSWTGFYVGGAIGAGAIVDEIRDTSGIASINGIGGEGVFGELSVGYDHEFNDIWVAGIQLGGRYSGMTTQLMDYSAFGGPKYEGKADYGFDVIARVGAKLNPTTLAYVLGGYSWQHVEEEMSVPGYSETRDWNVDGYSIGGGLETAVTNNLSVNLEYRFSQFDGHVYEDIGSETIPAFHTVRIGTKYKFN
nr:outer membrane beta-barrel protein [Aminobacter sp. HY435]